MGREVRERRGRESEREGEIGREEEKVGRKGRERDVGCTEVQ